MSNVTLNETSISYSSLTEPIEELASAQLLGAVWNWCLYGALVVQVYVYSYNFSQDNKYIKLLVYSIFFLETVQTALSGADLYYWFAAGFDNVYQLTTPFASFFDLTIMGSVVSLCVQFFFVYRIFVLSKKQSRWLCGIICLFSIVSAIGAFAAGIISHLFGAFIEGRILDIFVMIWIIGNTLSDLLITSTMLYHLKRIRADSSIHVLVSIVRLTVETNLATTTVSIAALLMILVYPDENWYVCPSYILGKLYSNTLLVSLNNRISIRDTYEARGAVVDHQVVTGFRAAARPEVTTDTIIMVPIKPDGDYTNELVAEAKVEERVNTPATMDSV